MPLPQPLELPDPASYDAVIFDCDGTLADTMPVHYQAWCKALGANAPFFPEPVFYSLGGVPTVRIVELLNEQHGLTLPPDATVEIKEQLFLQLCSHVEPIAEVVAFAESLRGKKPISVASGGHRHVVHNTLQAINVFNWFEHIITAEDYSRGKPHPDPFLVAAERMGVPPERCLVFEDSVTGLDAARAANMLSVFVPAPIRA
jgi:HAD superfamily hydrolase (TIGR01509 family)